MARVISIADPVSLHQIATSMALSFIASKSPRVAKMMRDGVRRRRKRGEQIRERTKQSEPRTSARRRARTPSAYSRFCVAWSDGSFLAVQLQSDTALRIMSVSILRSEHTRRETQDTGNRTRKKRETHTRYLHTQDTHRQPDSKTEGKLTDRINSLFDAQRHIIGDL